MESDKIEKIFVKKIMTNSEISKNAGKIWKDHSGCRIFNTSVDIMLDNNTYLARFRKNMIPLPLCQLGLDQYIDVGFKLSNNRGNAAGRYDDTDSSTLTKKFRSFKVSDKVAIFETDQKQVNSGIMGFMDSPNWRHPCRQTAFTKSHFEQYNKGLPFIKYIDNCYKKLRPIEYQSQRDEAVKSNYHIEDTSFSTVTVNANFQTGLHKDSGDYVKGFGNLVVVQKGEYSGGYTLFPQYGVGFDCRMKDFLAMDVHHWHCNTPIICEGDENVRLSFVCYLRQRMHQCPMLDKVLPNQEKLSSMEKIIKMVEWTGDKTVKGSYQREELGTGRFGHKWYQITGQKYKIKYYNKQYTITDLTSGIEEYSLTIAFYNFLQKIE